MMASNGKEQVLLENVEKKEILKAEKEFLNGRDEELDYTNNSETQCGLGCGYSPVLQRFANQSIFIIAFGLIGSILNSSYSYFNGTISTLEKRFHMSSRSIGVTQIGCDFTQMFTSLFLIHYLRKKHRPRWMAVGTLLVCIHSFIVATMHWFYGAGNEALKLTKEYTSRGLLMDNVTNILDSPEDNTNLCNLNGNTDPCETETGTNYGEHPVLVLFLSHALSGFGWSLFYTLGYVYMDDNVEKTKIASMYSFSEFLNMLGPSLGYTLAAFCLHHYVSPSLTPIIDNRDQRWVGAWWMGWAVIGITLFFAFFFLAMLPKKMPAVYKRQLTQLESLLTSKEKSETNDMKIQETENSESYLSDLSKTLKRIMKNKIYMCNNIGSIFYCFGYMPYWIFTSKYLEIVFRQSASESKSFSNISAQKPLLFSISSVYTGTVALVFKAIGVLTSGTIISKKKPRARTLAAWNAVTSLITVAGFFSYSFIGCPENENSLFQEKAMNALNSSSLSCAEACHCEFVPYSPVCGENNLTYISPCHAGCKEVRDEGKIFYDCDCIRPNYIDNQTVQSVLVGTAKPGACSVDCFNNFLYFLVILCTLKFFGATTKASYFLIQIRSVAVEDKTVSLGFTMVMESLLSFIPSPIFFGWIFDRMCLVWGGTCSEEGNCWLYDSKRLRYTINYTASAILLVGALFDCWNCYLVRDLKLYDDDEEKAQEENIASNRKLSILGENM